MLMGVRRPCGWGLVLLSSDSGSPCCSLCGGRGGLAGWNAKPAGPRWVVSWGLSCGGSGGLARCWVLRDRAFLLRGELDRSGCRVTASADCHGRMGSSGG